MHDDIITQMLYLSLYLIFQYLIQVYKSQPICDNMTYIIISSYLPSSPLMLWPDVAGHITFPKKDTAEAKGPVT